jgi:hypothetical protein
MPDDLLTLDFVNAVWYWRGPAPYHFVSVPDELCVPLRAVAGVVTYGWGMIPVTARVGGSEWVTSLTPKDGGYALPLKDVVRTTEGIAIGDAVTVRLIVRH